MRLTGRLAVSLPMLAALATLAACERSSNESAESPAPAPALETDAPPEGVLRVYVWECDGGLTLTMKNLFRENAITIGLHEGARRLPQVRSASGARYADDTVSFWTKGQTAMFERKGEPAINCRESRAKSLDADARERGVSYRGQGNEPGWTLEIGPGQSLTYETNYGQERHEFENVTTQAGADARVTVYRGQHGDMPIKVTVAKEACRDDMSGDDFDHRFVVEFGGQTYRGCGWAL